MSLSNSEWFFSATLATTFNPLRHSSHAFQLPYMGVASGLPWRCGIKLNPLPIWVTQGQGNPRQLVAGFRCPEAMHSLIFGGSPQTFRWPFIAHLFPTAPPRTLFLVHAHALIRLSAPLYAHTLICTLICSYAYIHAYMHICSYAYMHVYMLIRLHAHTLFPPLFLFLSFLSFSLSLSLTTSHLL